MEVETGQAPPARVARLKAHERPLADRRQVERAQPRLSTAAHPSRA